jgi:2-oxoisovalerate ferredoxin oxidoreductase beta subunit
MKARTAIRKALQLQVENRGFSLVEVLSECPLHLGRTPEEAERWVKEQMVPVFPLGVKKDVTATRAPWPAWTTPDFSAARAHELVGGGAAAVPRCSSGFPRDRYGAGVALKLAGAGGDGAQTAAMIVVQAAINEGFDATHIPSYGPESRGGTSYADVRIAEAEVLSPAAPHPDVLVAFNAPSLAKFAPAVADGGVVLYDSSVMPHPAARPGIRAVPIPAASIASSLGRMMVKNVVMLGALAAATAILPEETLLMAIRQALRHKPALVEINERAFAAGARAAREAREARDDGYGVAPCPRAQADGVPCDTPSADCEHCPDAVHA